MKSVEKTEKRNINRNRSRRITSGAEEGARSAQKQAEALH
jgi:hypothetical protein